MLDRASRGWRGVQQTVPSVRLLAQLRRELFGDIPIAEDQTISDDVVIPAA